MEKQNVASSVDGAESSCSDLRGLFARRLPLWRVAPDGRCSCGEECTRPGKHPKPFTDGSEREEDGFAVVTGAQANGGSAVFVLDVDTKDGRKGDEELIAISGGDMPSTLTVRTGSGGFHFYFKHPGFRVSNRKPSASIDIKGDRATADGLVYVVGPGSPGYVKTDDPAVVTPADAYEVIDDSPIAEAPDWLLGFLRMGNERRAASPVTAIDESHKDWEYRLRLGEEAARTYPPSQADGQGGKRLFLLCLRLVRALELPLDVCFELIDAHFNPRCTDANGTHYPWSPDEIDHKLEDARDRSDIEPGILSEATTTGLDALGEKMKARREQEEALHRLRQQANETTARNLDPEAAREAGAFSLAWTLKLGDAPEIAAAIEALVRDDIVFTDGAFYSYDKEQGIWTDRVARRRLLEFVWSMSGAVLESGKPLKITKSVQDHALEILAARIEDKEFFASAADGIACPNGFLKVSAVGAALVPHDKEHRARAAYPIEYRPGVSDVFAKYLDDLFRDDADKERKIETLAEFAGASLFGFVTRYERAVLCVGEGENGKSSLFDLLRGVFPEGSTCTVQPQTMVDQYRRAALVGRRLNAIDELSSKSFHETEDFKAAATGQYIDARDPHKAASEFRPVAGWIAGANRLPRTSDLTKGFWRRWILIQFNRNFTGIGEKGIIDRLLETERESVFAWLVDGAVRLLARDDYDLPPSHHKALAEWKGTSNPVSEWVADMCLVVEHDAGRQTTDLYRYFAEWLRQNGYRPVTSTEFGTKLNDLHPKGGKHKTRPLQPLVGHRITELVDAREQADALAREKVTEESERRARGVGGYQGAKRPSATTPDLHNRRD